MTNGPGNDGVFHVSTLTRVEDIRTGIYFKANTGGILCVPSGRICYKWIKYEVPQLFSNQLEALEFFRDNGDSAYPIGGIGVYIDFARNGEQSCCLIGGGVPHLMDINILIEALVQVREGSGSTQPPGGPSIH